MRKISMDLCEDVESILSARTNKLSPYINELISRYAVLVRHSIPKLSDSEWDSLNECLPEKIEFWQYAALEGILLAKNQDKRLVKKISYMNTLERISLLDQIEVRRMKNE